MKMPKTKQKVISIQLLRIICCIFVISIHIFMNFRHKPDGSINTPIIFVEAFTRCCVPVFFMITGYFFSTDVSLKKTAKNLFFKLLIPTIPVFLFIQLLNGYKATREFSLSSISVSAVLDSLVKLRADRIPGAEHLWYIFALVNIYIWYPVFRLLCAKSREATVARRYVTALSFLGLIAYQTIVNIFPGFPFRAPAILSDYSLVYFLLGFEIKANQETLKKIKPIWGILLYIVGSILVFIFSYLFDYGEDNRFLHKFFLYNNIFVCIAAVGLFIAFTNLDINRSKAAIPIKFIADRTYVIYLYHLPLINLLITVGLIDTIRQNTPGLISYPLMVFLTFMLSFLLAVIAFYTGLYIKKFLSKFFKPGGAKA